MGSKRISIMTGWFVISLIIFLSSGLTFAAELSGTITGIKGESIYIKMSSKELPQKNDPVKIIWVFDGEEIDAGKAKVTSVKGGNVTARTLEGDPAIDMKVTISTTAAPAKKDASYMDSYQKCSKEKNYDIAIEHCNKALKSHMLTNKMRVTSYFNRAYMFSKKDKYSRAISDYSSAIRINPNDHELWYERGRNYRFTGAYDLAVKDFTQAIKLKPDYKGAYNNRGLTYKQQKKYNEAIRDYNEAIRLDPKEGIFYSNRGVAYSAMGNYKRALEDHNRAIELDPSNGNSYANRGSASEALGKKEEALKDWKKAHDLGYSTSWIIEELRKAGLIK